MKKTNLLFAFIISTVMFACTPKEFKVTVENTEDFDRTEEIVEIPINVLESKITLKEGETYVVKSANGNVLESQITSDGKFIFQSGLKAKEKASFSVESGAAQKFNPKTFGRFITERKDDFAWENDRVAFRLYGPALVETDGPSNGFDIWFKRTNNLIIDKWYKDDLAGVASYHEDHGEGLDDYKVGRSLGAGAMAPYVNDKLWLNDNFVSQEVLDNGPLRTTFKLGYKDIEVDGKTFTETRIISIDAGNQAAKITQEYGADSPIQVAAGIVKRENDSIIASTEKGYVIYAEPKSEKVDNIYLTLIFPEGITKSVVDTYNVANNKTGKEDTYSHVLGVANYTPNTPISYYTGYGWSKFGFETLADFQQYVENFSKGLKNPLVVKY